MDCGDKVDAIVKLNGFAEVAIGSEVVAPFDVFIAVGGAQHDDGDVAEDIVAFNLFEDFGAATTGEIEVEKNKVGSGGTVVATALEEEVEGFFAVAANVEVVLLFAATKGFDGDFDVGGVIFNEENFKCFVQFRVVLSFPVGAFRGWCRSWRLRVLEV